MICDDHSESHIDLTDRIIVRNHKYDVMSKDSNKRYSITYTKRRRLSNSFDTLPYGFKSS
ncbi:hypothetical protein BDFB_013373 [Asbolus verrucosus]|uniref:Uncharacterized protein n=1 Tax=Asbolus verrucosus TaxID=1661398 RepID=A0A482VNP2_ASBVE|nr:hypothetical protein BDFB_013373 [Asbolus verrucosus]